MIEFESLTKARVQRMFPAALEAPTAPPAGAKFFLDREEYEDETVANDGLYATHASFAWPEFWLSEMGGDWGPIWDTDVGEASSLSLAIVAALEELVPGSARRASQTRAKANPMRQIIIDVAQDRMGNVLLTPRNERVRRQMKKHNKEWTNNASDDVFLQESKGDEFIEEKLTSTQARDVNAGYKVGIKMDPWEFGHYVGYDFHEVINP